MFNVNLLPWRAAKRLQEKKQWLYGFLLTWLGALGFVLLINGYALRRIAQELHCKQDLEAKTALLEHRIKAIRDLTKQRKVLVARMQTMNTWAGSGFLLIHLLDELTKVIPNGAYLLQVSRSNETVTLLGHAKSHELISHVSRNIESNDWMHSPMLTTIQKSVQQNASKHHGEQAFQLRLKLKHSEPGVRLNLKMAKVQVKEV